MTTQDTEPRTCGTCAACCTHLGINELKKYPGQTCVHLKNGDPLKRCGIYATRPEACQTYMCAWRAGLFPDDFRPNDIGFIISAYPPDIFVIQVFDRYKAGNVKSGKLADAINRLLISGQTDDVRIIDTHNKEVLHFYKGQIHEGKLLKQSSYEDLKFATYNPPIGRYTIKQQD